jgi:hypothetical protein
MRLEVGTTLKHPETINGNVKNLSKRMKMKDTRVGEIDDIWTDLKCLLVVNEGIFAT